MCYFETLLRPSQKNRCDYLTQKIILLWGLAVFGIWCNFGISTWFILNRGGNHPQTTTMYNFDWGHHLSTPVRRMLPALAVGILFLCGSYFFHSVDGEEFNQQNYLALKELYFSTNGENWNWLEPEDIYGYSWNFTSATTQNPCIRSSMARYFMRFLTVLSDWRRDVGHLLDFGWILRSVYWI